MLTDKEIKKQFKKEASMHPEKYYAVDYLKKEGFHRHQCEKCGIFFWTVRDDQKICGDPSCVGGFSFIGDSPAKHGLDYIETWKTFAKLFKKLGYTPIKRYPAVARWRADQYWVGASIYDFQPHVVSGEVEPPANPLVVPQFCLRFNDIENVGITGSHFTGFIMIGQHMFVPKDEWDQNKVFGHIHTWLKDGLGLPNDEITFHEDAWAGGGNFGPCMEYFSRGLELGNQVYMLFEQTPNGRRELPLKVLDMGMGHERNAWFSKGTSTSYETAFPSVCKKLYALTNIRPEGELMQKFLPYASVLNIDEVDDIDKAWADVAKKIGIDVKILRKKIQPLAELYSVAEHSRSALFAIADGALPSNVGGGYNLRVIIRRAMDFIRKNGWKTSMQEICEWHADYLKPLFPELKAATPDVKKILDIESKKYNQTKKRAKQIIANLLKKGDIPESKLIEIYHSQGISPEMIQEQAILLDKVFEIPKNFYTKVADLQEQTVLKPEKAEHIEVDDLPETDILYYRDFSLIEFKGIVLKIIGKKVILDKTAFYPTSGGQMHDLGTLGGVKVVNVFKQGNIIIHELAEKPSFEKGNVIVGNIDYERRLQLAQHHTSAHIINGAAKEVLGNHVWQAGAQKDIKKARLDITHYEALSEGDVVKIENVANRVVYENLPVYSDLMKKNLAELEYGFRIYQGGAVPGKILRIVKIENFDVEACGGTHLHLTGEAKRIKIIKTSKIQDGIVRIEFAAGNAAADFIERELSVVQEAARLLNCEVDQVPARSEELFKKWKKVVKKRKTDNPDDFKLSSVDVYDGDALKKTSEILRTQSKHIVKTIKRFLSEIDKARPSGDGK